MEPEARQGLHIMRGDFVLTRDGEIVEVQLCGLTADGQLIGLASSDHIGKMQCISVRRSIDSTVVLYRIKP